MQTRLLALLVSLLLTLSAVAQSVEYSTPTPRIEDVNDRDVVIKRIDLTAKYTIIYMRFVGNRLALDGSSIHFVPTARLYANGGARSFKFVQAENIPTDLRRKVYAGEKVDFVAYFERLDPGIEVFDLFECSDRNRPGEVCFNFWGVHVVNPLKRQRQTAPLPPAKPRPAPVPAPKPTPEPDIKPTPPVDVLAIKGVVRDAKTGKPVPAMTHLPTAVRPRIGWR